MASSSVQLMDFVHLNVSSGPKISLRDVIFPRTQAISYQGSPMVLVDSRIRHNERLVSDGRRCCTMKYFGTRRRILADRSKMSQSPQLAWLGQTCAFVAGILYSTAPAGLRNVANQKAAMDASTCARINFICQRAASSPARGALPWLNGINYHGAE